MRDFFRGGLTLGVHKITFPCLLLYIATKARFDETAFQWEHIDLAAPRLKRNLRTILQAVEFATPSTNDPLIEAVHFLKAAFPKGKPLGHYADIVFPTRCIPDKFKRYLYLKDAQRHRKPAS